MIVEQWLDQYSGTGTQLDDNAIEEHLWRNKQVISSAIQNAPSVKWGRWLQVAAAVVLTSAAAVLFWIAQNQTPDKQEAVKRNSINVVRQLKNGWWYIRTPKGKSYTDTLADGSIIAMNAGSRLHFPADFPASKRPVYLDEGEALFKVAKNKARPFTVYTPGFSTTALGTEFNIRTYHKEQRVAVSLLHGKILVKDLRRSATAPETHILMPHQQLIAASVQSKAIQSAFNNEDDIVGWQSGLLSFKDADATEVINQMENRFDVTIINKSAKTHWSYTGAFRKESLAEVLRTITLTEGINYTIHNQTVTLY
jgi:transmembrane sensor